MSTAGPHRPGAAPFFAPTTPADPDGSPPRVVIGWNTNWSRPARSVPGFTALVPAGSQTCNLPLDRLRTESKKWQAAYDEFVRGAKGTGN
jgi:hypothetical protein